MCSRPGASEGFIPVARILNRIQFFLRYSTTFVALPNFLAADSFPGEETKGVFQSNSPSGESATELSFNPSLSSSSYSWKDTTAVFSLRLSLLLGSLSLLLEMLCCTVVGDQPQARSESWKHQQSEATMRQATPFGHVFLITRECCSRLKLASA